MKLPIYNTAGKEVKKIDVSDEIFGLDWNGDLVHQVVNSIISNTRQNIAHTKDRSEVSGGGKKPWRQKGTGRARHGSTRSPIWVGGGTTFGPRNTTNYSKKINKKMRAKALAVVLSQKVRDNELILIDSMKMDEIKTAKAQEILKGIATVDNYKELTTKRKNTALIGLSERDDNTERSFANFSNMYVDEVRNFNPAMLMQYKYVVIEGAEKSIEALAERLISNNK